MLPSNRAQTFENAPLAELLCVLLRQLKRPLAAHGLQLTDADAERLAHERIEEASTRADLLPALAALVAESEAVLAAMGLTYTQSLDADMTAVGGWETTAELLELANEKTNAELRITLGSALALAFGAQENSFADYLRHLAAGDYGDESVIARRVLNFVTHKDAP